jgi:DNA-binding response OmpR family regulator
MKILIVDGERAVVRALERVLRMEHVTVVQQAVVADGYDLVLGDRADVLATIQAQPGSPPCVLLAAEESAGAAFDAVVVKPVTWRALCEAVGKARVARRRRAERKPRRSRRRYGVVTQEL